MIIANITLWAGILLALITKAKYDGCYEDEIYYDTEDEITYFNDDIWS